MRKYQAGNYQTEKITCANIITRKLYKGLLLRAFIHTCIACMNFRIHLKACFPIIQPQLPFPKGAESWRRLHLGGFRASYWIAVQSPLAISQDARSHFPYEGPPLRSRAYIRRPFNGGPGVASSLWSLSKGSSITLPADRAPTRVRCFAVVNVISTVYVLKRRFLPADAAHHFRLTDERSPSPN